MSPDGSWTATESNYNYKIAVAADGSWVMNHAQATISTAVDGSWVVKHSNGNIFTVKADGTWVFTDAAGNTGTSEDGKANIRIPKAPDISSEKPSKDATTPKKPVQPKKVNS